MKPKAKEEKDIKSEYIEPGVGVYNPDKIYSIEYNLSKKVNKFSLIAAPFSSLVKRFDLSEQQESNLGPGYYHKNKRIVASQQQAPFSTKERKSFSQSNNRNLENKVGPGDYDIHSYFDWNKKSFNIQFL